MGILDRTSQILRANVNDLLNRAEDPERMLNQILSDMEDAIRQGQKQVGDQIAQEKLIQADLETARQNADAWGKKAELAVSKGADDLAREALHRQGDYSAQVDIYQKQADVQHQAVQKLKTDLAALQDKYEDARRNKEMLITRAKRASAQQQIASASAKLASVDYSSDLQHMERRIQEQEAHVAAAEQVQATSVDEQFKKLGADDAVEQKLADLKKKMGK
ncbi:MAG: PspA/IM30 family protein [Chloroflexota bacterium]|nr:PspA/IM30 family protein [Chloroflexota bacterium]